MLDDYQHVPKHHDEIARRGNTVVTQYNALDIKELGYHQPTDDQAEVLQKFVSGRDVFISLPTGSDKSQTLCFTCVSLVFDNFPPV